MSVLDRVVGALPVKLQPIAKAMVPAVTTLVGVGVSWAMTGELNATELQAGASGLALAVVVYLIPNKRAV